MVLDVDRPEELSFQSQDQPYYSEIKQDIIIKRAFRKKLLTYVTFVRKFLSYEWKSCIEKKKRFLKLNDSSQDNKATTKGLFKLCLNEAVL